MYPAGRVPDSTCPLHYRCTKYKTFRIFLGRSKETLLTGWALGNLAAHFSRIYIFHMSQGLRLKPNLDSFSPQDQQFIAKYRIANHGVISDI